MNNPKPLAGKRLVVLVGEGGVGKTSMAAAVAWAAAQQRRVGVLTVDPAPRLGDALGQSGLGAQPQPVPLPEQANGSLEAMRLDVQATFDRMVENFAPNKEAAEAIVANPIYAAVSGSLGGSEHYMAFQRLHELLETTRYDVVVVDTPPAANAGELLSAPARLGDLLDTGALSILAQPARLLARTGSQLARATLAVVLVVVERVFGGRLRKDLSDFVTAFEDLLEGLRQRSASIDALLRAPETAFVLVVRPRPQCVERALAFHTAMTERGLHIDTVILNRSTPAPGRRASLTDLTELAKGLPDTPPGVVTATACMERDLDDLRRQEKRAERRLRQGLAAGPHGTAESAVVRIGALADDVASLDDIATLAAALGRAGVV